MAHADAGYAGSVCFVFDAGAEGPDGVEGRKGVSGGEVIANCDGLCGEKRYQGSPV